MATSATKSGKTSRLEASSPSHLPMSALADSHCLTSTQIRERLPLSSFHRSERKQHGGALEDQILELCDVLTWSVGPQREEALQCFMLLVCVRGDLLATRKVASALGHASRGFCDKEGVTPLHAACFSGHLEVVVYLVTELRANLNALDHNRATPLQVALQNKHNSVIQYLQQITMALAVAAQEIGLVQNSRALAYSRSAIALLSFGKRNAVGKDIPLEREEISYSMLSEVPVASGALSTVVKSLTCSFQVLNLPSHKGKLKRPAKPNPILCVVNLKPVQILVLETQDTTDPKFPQIFEFKPILVPTAKQFLLVAIYDSQPGGFVPIGYTRILVTELIRPAGSHRFTVKLARMAGQLDIGPCGELIVEIGVVAFTLGEHIDLSVDQTQGRVEFRAELAHQLTMEARALAADEIIVRFLRWLELAEEATEVIRLRKEQQKALSGPFVLTTLEKARSTTAKAPTLGEMQGTSSLLRSERLRILKEISPNELLASGRPLIPIFQHITSKVADFRASTRNALRAIQAAVGSLIPVVTKVTGYIDACGVATRGAQSVTVVTSDQDWKLFKPMVVGIQQAIVKHMEQLRFNRESLTGFRTRLAGRFLALGRPSQKNFHEGSGDCSGNNDGVHCATSNDSSSPSTHNKPASVSGSKKVHDSPRGSSDCNCGSSNSSSCSSSGESATDVDACVDHGEHNASSKDLTGELAFDEYLRGTLHTYLEDNAAFVAYLKETLFVAAWLHQELLECLLNSAHSTLAFLVQCEKDFTQEIEQWEVERKFYTSFHSTLHSEVRAVGLEMHKRRLHKQKEVKLRLAQLEVSALQQDLDGGGLQVHGFDMGVETVNHKAELEQTQRHFAVLRDEIEYLTKTFVIEETHQENIDTMWFIPASSIELQGKAGAGEYGDVYKGTLKGVEVAVKVLKGDYLDAFNREFGIWRELRFPNIIQLLGYTKMRDSMAMVMPFCDTSLAEFLQDCPPCPCEGWVSHPSWLLRIKIATQIAAGMAYLHACSLMHRDLKCANVLLQGDGKDARIADFGFSKKTSWARSMSARGKGSPITMAPEVYYTGKSSLAADVYSYGIVLWEIIYCQPPYGDLSAEISEVEFMEHISKGQRPQVVPLASLPKFCQAYQQIAEECWAHEPEARPTFKDLADRMYHLEKKFRAAPFSESQ